MHTKIFKYVRTALLLLLLAVVLVHSVLWVIGAIGAYRRGMFLVDVEDFSDCKDSFDLLSEKWLPYYEAAKENEEDLLTLSIRHNFFAVKQYQYPRVILCPQNPSRPP